MNAESQSVDLARAKRCLRIASVGFFGFGLWGLLAPDTMLGMVGAFLTAPAARAEARAFYGGLELGFGGFLIFASRRNEFTAAAALAACSIFFGCVTARIFGMCVDAVVTVPLALSGLGEFAGGVLTLWAYRLSARPVA